MDSQIDPKRPIWTKLYMMWLLVTALTLPHSPPHGHSCCSVNIQDSQLWVLVISVPLPRRLFPWLFLHMTDPLSFLLRTQLKYLLFRVLHFVCFHHSIYFILLNNFFFFFAVLGLELRAYTLSHSTSPFCAKYFRNRSCDLFAWAGFEPFPPDLCLLSSEDYRCQPPAPGLTIFFKRWGSCYAAQAELELLGSCNPPTSVS
jgi:hypothetical protein